jgi:magnesium transporter
MEGSFSTQLQQWRQRLEPEVYRILNDDLMMGLAAVLAAVVILPLIFSFTPTMLLIFEGVNYLVVAVFLAEYLLKLFVARSRLRYIFNPWHILDVAIIAIAALDFIESGYVPFIEIEQGTYTPFFKMSRLLFALVVAGRTVERAMPEPAKTPVELHLPGLEISALEETGEVIRLRDKEALSLHSRDDKARWIDIQNLRAESLDCVAEAINIPRYVLESKLIKESFPRIDYFQDFVAMFIWDSMLSPSSSEKNIDVIQNGMLVIYADKKIFTISTGKSDLFDRARKERWPMGGYLSLAALYAILRCKIRDYEEIVRAIETRTLDLEAIPVNKTYPRFLEETFQFRKDIQKTVNNLWHFKQVLEYAKLNRVALKGFKEEHLAYLDILQGETDYMYETAQNIRESLHSLIDLHINTVSYDINRVMKILAVITCLGLIPAIIGGLLGVNLIDEPYHMTIQEVFFLVFSLMVLGSYAFYKLGWLR